MKQIFFPGNSRQPCVAQYGIFIESGDSYMPKAHIVVVQTHGTGTSLVNTEEGRDSILNQILDHDLNGVRVEFITFSLIYIAPESTHGFQFPIKFNMDDYISRGNKHDVSTPPPADMKSTVLSLLGKGNKTFTVNSYDVVGGCTRFFLDFNERLQISENERKRLLAAVEYKA